MYYQYVLYVDWPVVNSNKYCLILQPVNLFAQSKCIILFSSLYVNIEEERKKYQQNRFQKKKNYFIYQAKQKNMCVYDHMPKKSRVGWSALIFFFFFYYRQSRKQSFPVPEYDSGISFSKFPVSRHLLKLFYDELQFSTLFAIKFSQKASG